MNSPLYSDELLEEIATLCRHLKKGARLISLKELPERDFLCEFARVKTKMSWGN